MTKGFSAEEVEKMLENEVDPHRQFRFILDIPGVDCKFVDSVKMSPGKMNVTLHDSEEGCVFEKLLLRGEYSRWDGIKLTFLSPDGEKTSTCEYTPVTMTDLYVKDLSYNSSKTSEIVVIFEYSSFRRVK